MVKVHAIRTGLVQVREPQRQRRREGLAAVADMLLDSNWTEWLPVYAWVIDHDEGIIVVDTGETARVHEKGYHPSWHPFYRRAVRFSVHPDEEIGPQLRAIGISPRDVREVILTHLHTDHAGGVAHLTEASFGFLRKSGRVRPALPAGCRGICRIAGRSGGSLSLSASGMGRSVHSPKAWRRQDAGTCALCPHAATLPIMCRCLWTASLLCF